MKDKLARAGLADKVQVESAALHTDEIGSDIHRGTRAILEEYGIPFAPRQAHLAKRSDYDRFDYIVGMDRYNMRDMLRLFKNDPQENAASCSIGPAGRAMWPTLGIRAISKRPSKMLMQVARCCSKRSSAV